MKPEKDFYTFLMMKFMKDNPRYLDDDYPDVLDDWLAEIDPTELIELADQYAETIKMEG